MIEIKISNLNESVSRLVVISGQVEALHINVRRPIDDLTYYRQIAPILSPMVRADDSFMYVGKERLRMTVEPITGFMSCEGRSVVEIIQEVQREGVREDLEAWSPRNILKSIIDFEEKNGKLIEEQMTTLSNTEKDLLLEQEVRDVEDEDRKLEREILGTKQVQKVITPLEAARRRAAKDRDNI